jgi:beta-glucosidase
VQTWTSSIDQLLPILDYNIRDGRTYMYDRNKPLFPFGYGLSYTTFEYSGLKLSQSAIKDGDIVNISMSIKNTGSVNSDEVVQLYVSFPDSKVVQPAKALKGFKRVYIPAGETLNVTIPVKADELRYWNEAQHAFVLEKGRIQVMVGASSEDIRLTGTLDAN